MFGEKKYSKGRCDICGHETKERVIEIIDLAGHENCIYDCIEASWKAARYKCKCQF